MGQHRIGAAAGQDRVLKDLHRLPQGVRAPAPELGLDAALALEVQAAPARGHQARRLVAALDPDGEQLQGVAQPRAEHHRGIEALVTEAADVALHHLALPGEGGIDQRVELAAGDVAHHRLDVVEADAALPGGIQRELLDLGEARPAVSP